MHILTELLLICALCAPESMQPPGRPRVYFGERPGATGTPTAEVAESYRHMREASSQSDIRKVFDVALTADDADVHVWILERRVRVGGLDYGHTADRRPGAGNAWGTRVNELTARLTVPGLDVRVYLDGTAGAKKPLSFKELAERIVSQTAEWVTANREVLAERRERRVAAVGSASRTRSHPDASAQDASAR